MSNISFSPLAFTMPGMPEILVILVIVLLLFGAKKLPELARGLGQSFNEFRKARDEFQREIHNASKDIEVKETADVEPKDVAVREAPGREQHKTA